MTVDEIYNESCLETLARIPDSSIDLVITSPPYNLNLRISNGKYTSRQILKEEFSTKYEGFSDNLPIEEYYSFHKKVLEELIRTSNVIFYNIQIVTGSKRAIFRIIGELNEYLKDVIIWDKGHAQPAMKDRVLNRRSELILVFEKDYAISRQFKKANFPRGTMEDVWQIKPERKKHQDYHGATFPEDLVSRIVENFSDEGDVVYDPFLGTGTTAAVSKRLNRRYLGSEISKKYFDIANSRLSQQTLT